MIPTISTVKKQLNKILFSLLATLFFTASYGQFGQLGGDIDGEAANDRSGNSVSMPNANTIAVGTGYNDGNGTNAGHVLIYQWDGSSWTQKGLDIDGEAAGDLFGESLCMPDANTIAIGAQRNDGNGTDAGHVRIYSWDGSSWIQKGLDIDGEAAGDFSGYSVCMPDNATVAIGARVNDDGATNAGHVRVYRWNGSAWVQKGADIDGASTNDYFGHAISMPNAGTIAISSLYANQTGKTEVYSWNGSSWVLKGSAIYGDNFSDNSGYSVDMPNDNTLAIGAILGDDVNGVAAGNVKIFRWTGSAWTQKGSNIDGEAANDNFGCSVSMPDANTIAVGARQNDDCAGSDAGQVRVFGWNGSNWVKQGADINGEAAGDNLGNSVDMPDVNTLGIGAKFNDGNGYHAGHARVYTRCLAPDIPSSISASSSTICGGVSTTISWNGALNDASEWAIYASSCGCMDGSLVGTTVSNSIVLNPTATKTYYIRGIGCNSSGEGGCGTPITITVDDDPPTLASSPGDIDVVTPPNSCGAIVNYTPPLFDDYCDGNGLLGSMTAGLSSGSVFPIGTTTVTYTYTDGALQTIVESFDVTVTDNVVPTVSFNPGDIIVSVDPGTCGAVVNYTVTFDDGACGSGLTGTLSAGLPSGSLFPVGTTTVIHEYTDLSNNMVTATFDVVVTDDEAPLISGMPGDISIPGDSANCSVDVYWTAPTASDNCSISSLTSTHNSGDIFTQGTTTVSYTAEDAYGNITTLSFDVTVTTDLDGTVAVTPETTGNDGEIDLSATGGIMPPFLLYNWTGPNGYTSDNQDLFNLTSGLYELVISDLIGCVDTISVNLPFDCPSVNTTDVQSACDSYTWIDGTTYSVSTNTPTYTTTSVLTGCDSIITLDLTITNSVTWTDVQTACGSYTWIDGNTYASSTNSPTYTINNGAASGCDSIVTLNLTITSPSTGVDVQTSCGNFTWIDGNTYATSTNSPTYTISNGAANGCDSIVTLNLTINSSNTGDTTAIVCDSFDWYGTTYNTTGAYTHTLTNVAGCDSIVTLNLTINNNTGDTTAIACDSFDWYGTSYNTTGAYSHTLTNAAGCDSIVTLNLTINNSNTGDTTAIACDSFHWYGTSYNSTGAYTKTLTNVAGCDSIVTLNLTINSVSDLTTTTSNETISANNTNASYQWINCADNSEIAGATNPAFTATTNGNFAVVISENGCQDTSACVIIESVGIIENNFGDELKVYPNPTNGNFSIDLGAVYESSVISITDLSGKLIESKTMNQSQMLNLSINEPSGIYILSIQAENKKAVVRLVKE